MCTSTCECISLVNSISFKGYLTNKLTRLQRYNHNKLTYSTTYDITGLLVGAKPLKDVKKGLTDGVPINVMYWYSLGKGKDLDPHDSAPEKAETNLP